MKRSTELMPLSREHHEALVLARRACEPQRAQAEPSQLRLHVLQRWQEQFEPHFEREERILLAALRAAGATEAADEGHTQHAALRTLARRLRAEGEAVLPAWGDAMREHVQWEERELFPLAERLLDLRALAQPLAAATTQDTLCRN